MAELVKVGIVGALGRVGKTMCEAVNAAPDLELAATVDRDDDLQTLVDNGVEVIIDFTHPDVVMDLSLIHI